MFLHRYAHHERIVEAPGVRISAFALRDLPLWGWCWQQPILLYVAGRTPLVCFETPQLGLGRPLGRKVTAYNSMVQGLAGCGSSNP
jgi:hypothetical protein